MKTINGLLGVAAAAMGLALMLLSSAYAGQSVGDLSQKTATHKDTVVDPLGSPIQAPVSNVYWRGSGRVYGGVYPPYYRPYRYGTYYYGYRPYRCWWNGYRWKCKPRRVIVY
jgi:hypothetical protein